MKDKQLLLLNDQTAFDFKQSPKATEGISQYDFKVIKIKNLANESKQCFLRDEHGKQIGLVNQIPFDELDKNKSYAVALSPLIRNCYYPLDSFEYFYKKDMEVILKYIANLMGLKGYKFKFISEEEYKNQQNTNSGVDIDVSWGPYGGGAETDISATNSKDNKNINFTGGAHKSVKGITPKVTKERMKEILDENKINKEALPNFMRSELLTFLETGTIKGRIVRKDFEKISDSVEKSFKINGEAGAWGLIAQLPFKIDANFYHSSDSSSSSSSVKYIEYMWDFGD